MSTSRITAQEAAYAFTQTTPTGLLRRTGDTATVIGAGKEQQMSYVITEGRPETPEQFADYLYRRTRPSVADLWRFVLSALTRAEVPDPSHRIPGYEPPRLVAFLDLDAAPGRAKFYPVVEVASDGTVSVLLMSLYDCVSDLDGNFPAHQNSINAFAAHVLVADEIDYWHSPDEGGVFDIAPVRLKLSYDELLELIQRLDTVDADTIAAAAGLLVGAPEFEAVQVTAAETLAHLATRPFFDADMLWRTVLFAVATVNPYMGETREYTWSLQSSAPHHAVLDRSGHALLTISTDRAVLHPRALFRALALTDGDHAGADPCHAQLEAFMSSPFVRGQLSWSSAEKPRYRREDAVPSEWDDVYPESVELDVTWSALLKAVGEPGAQTIEPSEVLKRAKNLDSDGYAQFANEMAEANVTGPAGWREAFKAGLTAEYVRLLGRERLLYPQDMRGDKWRLDDLPVTCGALKAAQDHGIPADFLSRLTHLHRPWGADSLQLATEIFDSGAPPEYVNAFERPQGIGGLEADWEAARPAWEAGIPLDYAAEMA